MNVIFPVLSATPQTQPESRSLWLLLRQAVLRFLGCLRVVPLDVGVGVEPEGGCGKLFAVGVVKEEEVVVAAVAAVGVGAAEEPGTHGTVFRCMRQSCSLLHRTQRTRSL